MISKIYAAALLIAIVAAVSVAYYYLVYIPSLPKPIEVWIVANFDGEEKAQYENMSISEFERNNNVKVTIISVSSEEFSTKLESAYAAGGGPHLACASAPRLGTGLSQGFFEPINDVIAQIEPDVVDKNLLKTFRKPGDPNNYTLPVDWCPCFYLINIDVLKNGLGAETDMWIQKMQNGSWTLDDWTYLMEKCAVDLDGDGTVDQWFFTWPGATRSVNIFCQILWWFGNSYGPVDEPFGNPILNNTNSVAALKWLTDMKPWMMPGTESLSGLGDLFYMGKLGLWWRWSVEDFITMFPTTHPELNVTWILPPLAKTGLHEQYADPDYYVVLNNKPDVEKALAKKLLLYMWDKYDWWAVRGMWPVNEKGLPGITQKIEGTVAYPMVEALFNNWDRAHTEPISQIGYTLVNLYDTMVQRVLAGEATPEQAANEAQAEALRALGGT